MGNPIGRPTVPEALPRLRHLYDLHGAGGRAHIVTDDENLGLSSIDYCIDEIMANPGDPDLDNASMAVLLIFRRMTMTQRKKAVRRHWHLFRSR